MNPQKQLSEKNICRRALFGRLGSLPLSCGNVNERLSQTASSSLFTNPGIAQKQPECVDCQMCGVIRRRRQLAKDSNHFIHIDFSRFRQRAAGNQRRQSRSARQGGNAALGFEPDLGNSTISDTHREREHIAANRIFKLRDRIGRIECTGIARALKVVEELGGVHGDILERQEKAALLSYF
jgi:hypothetical protein